MFNDIQSAINYIESRRVKRTFEEFQDIVYRYKFNVSQKNMIHVAGTNGKGSTVNYIKEILMSHGYTVGTFTSPYMIVHNDRICVNGKMIEDDKLLLIINELAEIIEKENLSMFEIDVLIMLRYFDELDLDYRIIETGIGGLYDKTNVIDSICSVITNIGYDHQFMLGESLDEIAKHKAGIIKFNKPCFTTEDNQELIQIFKQVCKEKNSQLHLCHTNGFNGPSSFSYLSNSYQLLSGGSYQVKNALLAINVCDYLIDLDSDLVQSALDNFCFPGRFEKMGNIYLDGAHNVDGIMALKQTLYDQKISDVAIIFCALGDKDEEKMLELLDDYPIYLASFEDERLNSTALNYQFVLKQIINKYQNIVFTGSLHFISEVRKYLLKDHK